MDWQEHGWDVDIMTVRVLQRAVRLGVLLPLIGCQAPVGPGQNADALKALPQAHTCVANLPPFGHWVYARDDGVFTAPPNAQITVSDDGGWCQIQFEQYWGQQPIQAPLAVTVPPAHGQAVVGSVGLSLRIAYKPTPGVVGPDSFTVHMTAPDAWDIPVHVNVVH
jgi:hypothetical protein